MTKHKVEAAEEAKVADAPVAPLFRYACPRCTNTAIETTNKMTGVDVTCKSCGNVITLDDLNNYFPL